MNKKKFAKIAAGLSSAALAASMFMPMAGMAATQYTPVAGTSTSFGKYLIMDSAANVPNVTFDFSIAAGSAIPYTAGSQFQVFAGNDATNTNGVLPTITANQAAFVAGDTTYASAQSGDSVTLDANEKYAKKTVSIDFSGVQYKEPGIYRYILTETSAGQQGISYDTQNPDGDHDKERILDVYVTDNSGSLVVSNYILHDNVDDEMPAGSNWGSNPTQTSGALGDKSDGFVNEYTTYDMTFSKAVAGNQASRDKYFKFTVELSGAGAGTVYDVDVTGIDAAPVQTAATQYTAAVMGAANAADDNSTLNGKQIVTDAQGAATKDFYLQHGQSVVIKGLPAGAKYTVTEVQEDYKASATATGDSDVAIAAAGNSAADTTTGITADTTNAFTNTRDGIIPTGILLTGGIGLAAVAIGVGGFALLSKKKRNESDDDE